MKQVTITICMATLLFACNNQSKTADQPGSKDSVMVASSSEKKTETLPDSATMMKNWQAYMTPGKEHQLMTSWNGAWTGEVTMWYTPEAPPSKNKATAINSMILGGRYQQTAIKGSFDGMPFEGKSMLAYDNAKKVFISTWVDNMGTGIMVSEGPWDEANKSISFSGKIMDPGILKEMPFRETFKIIDNDHQLVEMYATDVRTGKEFKSMEIKYTRNK